MWRLLFIAFLIGHGVIQALQATGSNDSWLLGERRGLAAVITLTAAALFIAGGVALWAHADWWRAATVVGAVTSLAFFTIFFNPFIVLGMALDGGLIIAITWLHWPTVSMVEA
jgi:hypothetical protein